MEGAAVSKSVSAIRAELADREAIRDCLFRYCRGIDRCDETLLRTVYWPDSTDEHLNFVGSGEEFIAYVLPILSSMDQTQHLLGNILIQIDGAAADSETYFQAFHRMHGASNPTDFMAAGRYVDRFERRNDEWRISKRLVIIDWFRSYDDSADWSQGVLGQRVQPGGRKPDDRSYELLGHVV
jgi:hypothetical protein